MLSQAWWDKLAILAFRQQSEKDGKFKASTDYIVRPCRWVEGRRRGEEMGEEEREGKRERIAEDIRFWLSQAMPLALRISSTSPFFLPFSQLYQAH